MSKISDMDLQRHEVVDLNWVTDGTLQRIVERKSDRYEDNLRECFRRNLNHAFDYAKAMSRSGFDASEELRDAHTYILGLDLACRLLMSQVAKAKQEN